MILLLLLFVASLCAGAEAFFSVNLTNVGLSYSLSMEVGGAMIPLIVDTGNMDLTILNINGTSINFDMASGAYVPRPETRNTEANCLTLYEDQGSVIYYNDSGAGGDICNTASVAINVKSVSSNDVAQAVNVTAILARQFLAENTILHDWGDTKGNLGLGYCGGGFCQKIYGDYGDVEIYGQKNVMSVFRMLLYNVSGNTSTTGVPQILGLDFNEEDIATSNANYLYTNTSSMQLGDVLARYNASLKWSKQPVNFPMYHTFMATSIRMCGINLMQSVKAYTWPVLVDTGQVCMQLPSEMHTSLTSWLLGTNGSIAFPSENSLPSLMFQMDEGLASSAWDINVNTAEYQSQSHSDFLYIPLKSLLVGTSYFLPGQSAINITVAGEVKSLCILSNYAATHDDPPGMVNPPPSIVLGSMALRSLYFAANYDEVTVGLANKISSSAQADHFDNDKDLCVAKATCQGQQSYDYATNTCLDPECDNFFFAEIDPGSKNCVYREGMYNAGLTILILCVIFEVSAFFSNQYSSTQIMGVADPDAEGTMTSSRPMVTQVSVFTATVGKFFALIFDNTIKGVKYLVALRQARINEAHEHAE